MEDDGSDGVELVDEPHRPMGLSLLPDPLRTEAALVIGIPFLFVLVLAIHPWTFGSSTSSGPNNDSSSGVTSNYPSDDPSTTTSSDSDSQAMAVTAILTQAKTDRAAVTSAVADATECGDLNHDSTVLTGITDLTTQADNLSVDALDGASTLPQLLRSALADSETVNSSFLTWIDGEIDGADCSTATVTGDQSYQDAESELQTFDSDVQQLLDVWNPIAQQYGQQTWSTSDF
jgi:hypothetical protein